MPQVAQVAMSKPQILSKALKIMISSHALKLSCRHLEPQSQATLLLLRVSSSRLSKNSI